MDCYIFQVIHAGDLVIVIELCYVLRLIFGNTVGKDVGIIAFQLYLPVILCLFRNRIKRFAGCCRLIGAVFRRQCPGVILDCLCLHVKPAINIQIIQLRKLVKIRLQYDRFPRIIRNKLVVIGMSYHIHYGLRI